MPVRKLAGAAMAAASKFRWIVSPLPVGATAGPISVVLATSFVGTTAGAGSRIAATEPYGVTVRFPVRSGVASTAATGVSLGGLNGAVTALGWASRAVERESAAVAELCSVATFC